MLRALRPNEATAVMTDLDIWDDPQNSPSSAATGDRDVQARKGRTLPVA
jgi:hypothetical protein